ncbi:pentatricopeptide repeat-containing protein At5g66520 [Rosa chinensis]|uniref:pentatricopeptide repeat-containing protein At5g66520 n=1 Tax=Rosa chinensis TaxID=74649 RepID=UPI000D08DF1A|nr:pentatricopeptide repeat-containing protein At5g66520 [Rosa chinensis]
MRELKQIHTHIIKSPFLLKQDQTFLITRLLFFCALSDSGSQTYATAVFRVIKNPTLYVYNIMIRAYACRKTSALDKPASFWSLVLYKQMVGNGIGPNSLTFPFLVKECAARSDGGAGLSIHSQVLKYGCEDDVFVRNSLMNMYSVCRSLSCARRVFDEMPERDVVSWNSMIKGCLRSGELDEAMDVFGKMKQRSIFSWNSIITGCVQGGRLKEAFGTFS